MNQYIMDKLGTKCEPSSNVYYVNVQVISLCLKVKRSYYGFKMLFVQKHACLFTALCWLKLMFSKNVQK